MITKIFLCGFMGAGKTTFLEKMVAVSENKELVFSDLDHLIHRKASLQGEGMDELINRLGWTDFRTIEKELLQECLGLPSTLVLSLGGGTLEHNWDWLRTLHERGDFQLVWLNTPLKTCLKRAQKQGGRPLLEQGEEALRQLYESRAKIYTQADVILNPEEQNSLKTLQQLHEMLRS